MGLFNAWENLIGSPQINKVLRRDFVPVLRQNGFESVSARKGWAFHEPVTWVFEIRAVGSYFRQVTGWPSMSVGAWLGVYYDFCPVLGPSAFKTDRSGRALPPEYQCHLRGELSCSLDQEKFTCELSNPAEHRRKDIWWIEPDGSNLDEVVADIRHQFLTEGLEWYRSSLDLNAVFASLRTGRDTPHNLEMTAAFERHLTK